jgi:magnesium-dependent phosphatase 1
LALVCALLTFAPLALGFAAPMSSSRPKVVAFDLDGTIWSPDMYMLWGGGAPFTVESDEVLKDCSGQKVKLLGISGGILDELKTEEGWKGVKVAWVSCTDEPTWADECMRKFKTPMGMTLVERIDEQCIYKANKQKHFKDLKERTGVEYEEMIFFDNERGNIASVEKLGVTSVYCPDGMTEEVWRRGLREFEERG